jgi:hypothetical protein
MCVYRRNRLCKLRGETLEFLIIIAIIAAVAGIIVAFFAARSASHEVSLEKRDAFKILENAFRQIREKLHI